MTARLRPALILTALALAAYLPALRGEFVQDDHLAVEQNAIVQRADPVEILFTSYWEGAEGEDRTLYRPVVILSYALEQRIVGGARPLVSRLVNIFLHAAVSIALLVFARRIGAGRTAAAAAATLFALHPLHVEAVVNVVGRAELLSAGFSLLALLAIHKAVSPAELGPGRRRIAAWWAAAALLLALGSKEGAIATPVLLFALACGSQRPAFPRSGKRWLELAGALAPSLLAVTLYLTLRIGTLETLFSFQQPHELDNPLIALDGSARVGTALALLWRYGILLVAPGRLCADYSGGVIEIEAGLLAARALAGAAVLLALLALFALPWLNRASARDPWIRSFAALMFLAPYLVIGNLFFHIGTIFAERLLYYPSMGFCLLVGMLVEYLRGMPLERRLKRLALALAVVLLVLAPAVRTGLRCLDWRDDWTLFSAAARDRPSSPRAHFIRGSLLAKQGRNDEALASLEQVVALFPRHFSAWSEMGSLLGRQGRFSEAEACFRRGLEINPADGKALLNLGIVLRRQGRASAASRALHKAALWAPRLATVWAELGNLELAAGRPAAAILHYRRAIALGREDLSPRLAQAERLNRGMR